MLDDERILDNRLANWMRRSTDFGGCARVRARYWAVEEAVVVTLVGILEPVDRVHEA